ncbi:MAG: TMEM165/GDT1 family protein [Halobacteriaceae archaeon]
MADPTWFGVVLIAFGTQLAVLPGEKVQFIIAGLATRYHPLLVVSAAGTAFAGWTALEIVFGQWLQRTFPGVVLDAFTAGLFLLFAVMLYRSAPESGADVVETDGGAFGTDGNLDVTVPFVGWRVPSVLGGWLPIFAMMAFGEFGDKTQLVTIGLASNYGAHPTAIWLGEMLAIIPVSLANGYFFHRFSHHFDVRKAHYAGAALFAFFGLDTVLALTLGVSVWGQTVGEVPGLVQTLL